LIILQGVRQFLMAHASNWKLICMYTSELLPLAVVGLQSSRNNKNDELNISLVNEEIGLLVLIHTLAPENQSDQKKKKMHT